MSTCTYARIYIRKVLYSIPGYLDRSYRNVVTEKSFGFKEFEYYVLKFI